MKKGITKKILIVVVSALIIVMPFSIKAETFFTDYGIISAFQYFTDRGQIAVVSSNTDNPLFAESLTGSIPLVYGSNDNYNFNVYNFNDSFIGKYIGYGSYRVGTEGSFTGIIYESLQGNREGCQNCYLKLEDSNGVEIIQRNVTFNFSNQFESSYLETNYNLYAYTSGTIKTKQYDFRYANSSFSGKDQYLIFGFTKANNPNVSGATMNNTIRFQGDDGDLTSTFSYSTQRKVFGGINFYVIKFNANNYNGWYTIEVDWLNNKNIDIIPVFYGLGDTMSEYMYNSFVNNLLIDNNKLLKNIDITNTNIDKSTKSIDNKMTVNNNLLTQLKTLFESGNAGSQSSVNSADSSNSELESSNNVFIQQQNSFNNQMTNNLNNINTNFNLTENQGFVQTAAWFRARFNDLTSSNNIQGNNAFALMINFALIMGLALTILGKIRS